MRRRLNVNRNKRRRNSWPTAHKAIRWNIYIQHAKIRRKSNLFDAILDCRRFRQFLERNPRRDLKLDIGGLELSCFYFETKLSRNKIILVSTDRSINTAGKDRTVMWLQLDHWYSKPVSKKWWNKRVKKRSLPYRRAKLKKTTALFENKSSMFSYPLTVGGSLFFPK